MRYIRHISGLKRRLARKAVRVAVIDCLFITGGAYMFISTKYEDFKRIAEGIAFGFLISRWIGSNVHEAIREFLRAEGEVTQAVKAELKQEEKTAEDIVEAEDFFD